ncbi:MAG: UDP-N-acetylmuramoyl-L-alanyl-D-glutamate--2,6-diaminopimelate ligase [Myxococcales bacterium]|nr:UDP-N-acetylmuramoyl-L-alanyl-D-glutamate--2,6-diaminopimelate ligase [Myxococcales bacterium]
MTQSAMVSDTPVPGLKLGELARELDGARVIGKDDVRVVDVRQDSRRVSAGDLFAARSGGRADGATFVSDAVARGAAAIMIERGVALPDVALPIVEVSNVQRAIAFAAEAVHHHPSRAVSVVGITGTNGKTTTSYLATEAVTAAGGRAGRLGTLGFAFGADVSDSGLTTPEADEVTRLVARVRDRGGSQLVMEASSHALASYRVEAIEFAVGVFTNLTQDHLDFHGSMPEYAAAKLRLFTELAPRVAVVNLDDPFGARVVEATKARVLRVKKSARGADVYPTELVEDARGIRGRVHLPSGEVAFESRLVGAHNVDNLLAALAIVEALGLDVARAAASLGSAPSVPGRLERCDAPDDDVLVLVDYAHTPDALERVLLTCRGLTTGELICVFGCGGDRDRAKRPKMGDAVGRLATRAIVTNDNPRSEEPAAIAEAIVAGLAPHDTPFEVELDRSQAIERAVLSAKPGDVVLIAGKGHEPYQLIGAERRAFDDRDEARRALALRRGGGRS